VIIGDGPALADLKSLAHDLNVEKYINFTGYLRGEDLLAHLSSLDIGVIPDPSNPCNDKLSMNKVFEYMALGLPFVQFDLPQSRSEAGDAGLVARECSPEALAEVIVKLVDDKDARARMSAYGTERAKREFQWSNEKNALLEAYAMVTGGPGPSELNRTKLSGP
jgi:glycosyltransferase involved in cell wall biosynthesis